MRRISVTLTTICLSTCALLVAACAPSLMAFEAEGGSYDPESVILISRSIDAPAALGKPVEEAEDLRHDALVALRADSDEGAQVADLLTEEFTQELRSVPYYVESGTFDGAEAWIVFEVWGSQDMTLENTRLWVFEQETGRVLFTAAIN